MDAAADTKADAAAINMRTAIVILNWNTEGFLRDFLPGLLQSVAKVDGAEVVVADNGSTDGSLELMQREFPEVKTIAFSKNYGFTGGYNKAFNELYGTAENPLDNAPEYFLLINSDIEVNDGWLQPLVNWMDAHPECGACAPKLHSWQDRDMFEYAGAAGGYLDLFGYPFCRGRILSKLDKDNGQYDKPADVLWATGACLLVRSKVYAELGGLDERFFAHMEEIDLCWRMQLEGWKVTVVPSSVVYHVGGGTLPAESPFKLFLNFRNNLLMLEKNLAKTYALHIYKKGYSASKAARKGLRRANLMIFLRRDLDGLACVLYLFRAKWKLAESVEQANAEYLKLRKPAKKAEIAAYLENFGKKAEVNGLYGKSIVIRSLIKGKNIFSSIKEQDFIKV